MSLLQQHRLLRREFRVRGSSMEPAFSADSLIVATPYLWDGPKRGDVVILQSHEENGRADLKRVVGLPFERITWAGTDICVNGVYLNEPYARKAPAIPGDDGTVTLKEDEYFLIGDNRICSRDSRTYGPVKTPAILAHVIPQ